MKFEKFLVSLLVLFITLSVGLNVVSAESTDGSSNCSDGLSVSSVSDYGSICEDSLDINSADFNNKCGDLESENNGLSTLSSEVKKSDLRIMSVSNIENTGNNYVNSSENDYGISSLNSIDVGQYSFPKDKFKELFDENGDLNLLKLREIINSKHINFINSSKNESIIVTANDVTVGSNITGTVKGVNDAIAVAVIDGSVYYGFVFSGNLTLNSSAASAGKYSNIYMDLVCSDFTVHTVTFSVTINKIKSKIVDVTKGTVYNGNYYKLTVKDVKGKALVNKKVVITILGKKYTVTTNKNGVAKVKLSIANKYIGKSLKVSYKLNDVNYTSSSCSSTIKVIKTKTTITKVSSSVLKNHKYFHVKLTTKSGKALVKKVITMISSVSGKKYKIKTNSKGIAKINLWVKKCPLGKYYKYTFKYAGSSYYKSCSTTFKVKIVK